MMYLTDDAPNVSDFPPSSFMRQTFGLELAILVLEGGRLKRANAPDRKSSFAQQSFDVGYSTEAAGAIDGNGSLAATKPDATSTMWPRTRSEMTTNQHHTLTWG